LEAGNLRLRWVVVERITVIKFGVNEGGGNGARCGGIKVRMDTTKLSDMVVASFGDASAKLCGVEQRTPPVFGRATITLGIGPHSSFCKSFFV